MFSIFLTIVGCSTQKTDGVVIEVYDDSVLFAQDMSKKQYSKIETLSTNMIIEKGNLKLIEIAYKDARHFKKGDKVRVWIMDGIKESYPAMAKAKKIEQM